MIPLGSTISAITISRQPTEKEIESLKNGLDPRTLFGEDLVKYYPSIYEHHLKEEKGSKLVYRTEHLQIFVKDKRILVNESA